MTRHWFEDDNIRARLLANSPIGRAAQPEEMADMVMCSLSGVSAIHDEHLPCGKGGCIRARNIARFPYRPRCSRALRMGALETLIVPCSG